MSTFPASLDERAVAPIVGRLAALDAEFARRYPGEGAALQPVQTLYEGAHLFDADALARIRDAALLALERYGREPAALASAVGLPADTPTMDRVHARLVRRLESRPLDDYRLDFEDGYGSRPDREEDAEAIRAARAIGSAQRAGSLPPRIGLRVKPLTASLHRRSVRTLDLFVGAVADACGGLPPGFVVTLPKVAVPEQAAVFAELLAALEAKLGLAEGALRFEFMVELPQIVLAPDGRSPLPRVLEQSGGRAVAAHFGTYDYTAACGVSAAHQTMHHPACEFARQMMKVAFAGTGLWLSDGSTNVLPVEPHPDADARGPAADANRAAVHAAWRRHYDDVLGSLRRGFYQGWDLHPAQLVSRYAALYVFFLEGLEGAGARLRAMLAEPAAAGGAAVLDDPATGQALLGYVRRAVACGAVTMEEASEQSGLAPRELEAGSFVAIQAARAAGAVS